MSTFRIVVDRSLADLSLAEKAVARYGSSLERLSKDDLIAEMVSLPLDDRYRRAKRTLFFTLRKGPFLSPCRCPAGADYRCCGYHTIQSASGCPFDCSYCILQQYLANNPFISIFANRDAVEKEIAVHLEEHRTLRVGTGELADSLALDDLLDESGFFAAMIARNGWQKKVTFEFKTKSAVVGNLITAKERFPDTDLVLGLSVNIERFHKSEERDTAPMSERIAAAQRFIAVGGRVALHFDPLIMQEYLLDEYRALVDRLFSDFDRRRIAWVSLGGLRYPVPMARLVRERWPESLPHLGELFPSREDHKMRYFAPLRALFYRELVARIHLHRPDVPVHLCMEKDFMWRRSGLAT